MKTFKEDFLEVIREKCSFGYPIRVYMNHLEVSINDTGFDHVCRQVQTEIEQCAGSHFPVRREDLLISIQGTEREYSFKVRKTE